MKVQKSKEKFLHFAVEKMFKHIFVSGYLSCNPRLKKLRWPVRIVKLRKGQKYSKIIEFFTLKFIKQFLKL